MFRKRQPQRLGRSLKRCSSTRRLRIRRWSQSKEDGFELGADSLDFGGSYARVGARLVEVVAHRLEPREPLVVPLRVSGHEA
jgi:hypothetical protein